MNRLAKYLTQHADVCKKMEDILSASEATNGVLSAEQDKEYNALKDQRTQLEAAITREKEAVEAARRVPAVSSIPAGGGAPQRRGGGPARVRTVFRADRDPARGFRGPLDFIMAVLNNSGTQTRDNVKDDRLKPLAVEGDDDARVEGAGELVFMLPTAFSPQGMVLPPAMRGAVGSDEQGEYDDSYGGFLVKPGYIPGMYSLGFEGDPTAGRTRPLPMSSPVVKIDARTDKNHTSSVAGGLTVGRRAETAALSASRMQMEQITMAAAGLFGLSYATEELLYDSPISFAALLASGFADQFAHKVLYEKLRGKGGDEYLGILTALSSASLGPTIEIADRLVTSHLMAEDAINMRARSYGYGQSIWLANHDCLPDIIKMAIVVSDGGASPVGGVVSIYHPSIQEDRPDMLLGRPIFYTEYCSTLGSPGDLILANFGEFLEGLYQPLQSAESIHVRFVNHERAFKFWLRNAGAPWWRTPLTPNQSSSTLSPFIIVPT